MTREQVWRAVQARLRVEFGRLLDVREVRRVRKVAGDAWLASVVLVAPSGDLHVADLILEDKGQLRPELDGDDIIAAVRRAERSGPRSMPPELADFGADFGDESDDEDDGMLRLEGVGEDDEMPLEERVARALFARDRATLLEVRDQLPRLLTQQEQRGAALLLMAEVELELGEKALATSYIEAAAREFADRFDLDALERAAGIALKLWGREGFKGSPVHELLMQSRSRLKPVDSIYEGSAFGWLSEELRPELEQHLTLRTLEAGEMLVNEGEPSCNLFVVKSGVIGVLLERPTGGSWLVRCCFPGWLLGESSVLVAEDPRCMASLRAERMCEIWTVSADVVRELMQNDRGFARRIAETKQIHRIDSFFSMHETMGQLDVQVRDEILSCLQRLESFAEDTLLLPAHQVPTVACLVARGSIELFEDGKNAPSATVGEDAFYGVRDAIHAIAPSYTAIAKAGSTVAFFEGEKLQKLCERSPEHVVAVLERLG